MKSEKKAKLLNKLSHWVEAKSPEDIKTHMEMLGKLPDEDEEDDCELIPENYHYFNSSQKVDEQKQSAEEKKKRFLKYRSAPIL